MIRQDTVTIMFTLLAVTISLYLATFEPGVLILFPTILLITGLILQFYLLRRVEVVDSLAEPETLGNIGFYTLIAVAGLGVSSVLAPQIAKAIPMELTGMDAVLYAILMAVSEEQFFRGALTNFLLQHTQPMPAIIGSAAVFTVYHLGVYKTIASALVYVFIGGMILAWVGYRSGRLSPCVIAHIVNNVLAFTVIGGGG